MKIYDLKSKSAFDFDESDEKSSYIGETNQYIDFETLLNINGTLFRCCSLDAERDRLYVRKLNRALPKDSETYEDNLVCPYCGYEELDSFELMDDDDEYICPQCGSKLKYHREIEIHYDCEVVEEKEPIEVEFKK